MYSIRIGVFETSSSSCHSLIISRYNLDEILDSIPVNSDGSIEIATNYFGREPIDSTDAMEKASYFVTWCYGYIRKRKKCLKLLEEVIKDQTGARIITFKRTRDSGIDDNKWNTCNKIATSGALLRSFIFNPRSRLINYEC